MINLDESCTNDCPRCYNGGICNEYSGVCICGPGFYGSTCQDICEAETWGSECQSGILNLSIFGCLGRPELFGDPRFQYFCDYDDNNFLPPCRSKLFCLPHPYGCTCGPGWTGPECNRPCPEERYGPGCSLECHCEEQDCNDESGICIQGGCASGWTGENCQIECEEGKWGPECENDCGNCFNGTSCDRISKFDETRDTVPLVAFYHATVYRINETQ